MRFIKFGSISLIFDTRKSYLVICSEIGGANQILPIIRKNKLICKGFYFGSSKYAVKRDCDVAQEYSGNLINACEFDELIIAPAPNSFLTEIAALAISYLSNNKNVTLVMDNWVNFEIRFEMQPFNRVVTSDLYAFRHAREILGADFPLFLVENVYLENMRNTFKWNDSKYIDALFLDSRENFFTNYRLGKHGYLCICGTLESILKLEGLRSLSFRKHPGNEISDCLEGFIADEKFLVSNDSEAELIDDLNGKNLVVGNPSYALYIASELGITSYFANSANHSWHGPMLDIWPYEPEIIAR